MKNEDTKTETASFPPCCPELGKDDLCDVLDFHYRLIHRARLERESVAVEVIIHARIERCPGPLTLGDLVHTQTLLPGEKVRLATTDRRSRFTFDSATKVSYRHEQTQEEHFYMASMSDFMSDVTVRDSGRATNTSKGSAQGHGETSSALETIFGGPSVDVSGSHSAESTSDFMRELSQHAMASHHSSEMGTRASSAVSVGEVQTRTHMEGESQDHFESSSREFANPNQCHAVTFYFYRINKTQTVRLKIESITRRVIDPAADTKVTNNPFVSRGAIGTIASNVLATAKDRLEIERIGRASVAEQEGATGRGGVAGAGGRQATGAVAFAQQAQTIAEPLPAALRKEALKQVDERLVAMKLLTAVNGTISPEAQKSFSFEVRSSLPTPGMIVKGCLDDCDICEPERKRSIDLDLERRDLENQRLKREIELMDKDQAHRCCPSGTEVTP